MFCLPHTFENHSKNDTEKLSFLGKLANLCIIYLKKNFEITLIVTLYFFFPIFDDNDVAIAGGIDILRSWRNSSVCPSESDHFSTLNGNVQHVYGSYLGLCPSCAWFWSRVLLKCFTYQSPNNSE